MMVRVLLPDVDRSNAFQADSIDKLKIKKEKKKRGNPDTKTAEMMSQGHFKQHNVRPYLRWGGHTMRN